MLRNWAENKVNNKAHAVFCSLHAELRARVVCDVKEKSEANPFTSAYTFAETCLAASQQLSAKSVDHANVGEDWQPSSAAKTTTPSSQTPVRAAWETRAGTVHSHRHQRWWAASLAVVHWPTAAAAVACVHLVCGRHIPRNVVSIGTIKQSKLESTPTATCG